MFFEREFVNLTHWNPLIMSSFLPVISRSIQKIAYLIRLDSESYSYTVLHLIEIIACNASDKIKNEYESFSSALYNCTQCC